MHLNDYDASGYYLSFVGEHYSGRLNIVSESVVLHEHPQKSFLVRSLLFKHIAVGIPPIRVS